MASLIMNDKIRASEVLVTGLKGEALGVMRREEALALAAKLKADLVCTSLMSSPPPCKLVVKGQAKQQQGKEQRNNRANEGSAKLKVKELRLTPHIEEHDYETKLRQASKLLQSGNAVQLVVKTQNSKEGPKAKALVERMLTDLASYGKKKTGVHLSGKGASVEVIPS